jgi:hypothetical protein
VAYLKFSRDKRGYEHFYLLQPANRGKARPRMLYWFRTPPGVKVGRSPFDPEMRRALEAQNPAVVFDWEAITQTPIPPPAEPERWRERRRMERAGRAAETEEAASADAGEEPAKSRLVTVEPTEESPAVESASAAAEPQTASDLTVPSESSGSASATVTSQDGAARQGHRRRRRRGRRKPQVQGSGFTVQGSPVQGSEPAGSKAQESVIQDSGDSEDENREP